MINFQKLYDEAVVVSNAAEAFEDLVEFETTQKFVENVMIAQNNLIVHVLSKAENHVISAAAAGMKHADIFEFKGSELFEDFNILFMLFGGAEADRREQLGQYGFVGCFDAMMKCVSPFYLKHTWDRATNSNTLTLFWE